MPPLGRIPPNREPIGTTVVSDKVVPTYLHDIVVVAGSDAVDLVRYRNLLEMYNNIEHPPIKATHRTNHAIRPSPSPVPKVTTIQLVTISIVRLFS